MKWAVCVLWTMTGCAASHGGAAPQSRAAVSRPAVSAARLCAGVTYEAVAVSPDGREVAFTSDKGGAYEVWTVPFAGSAPPRQRSFAGQHARRPVYSPAGDLLLFENDRGGDEVTDLFLLRAGDAKPETLTSTPQAEHAAQFSPDGKYIVFEDDFDRPFHFDIAAMELATRKVTRLTHEKVNVRAPHWSPNGDVIVATRTADDQKGDLLLIDWPPSEVIPIAPPLEGGIFWPAGFARVTLPSGETVPVLFGRATSDAGFLETATIVLAPPLKNSAGHSTIQMETDAVAVGSERLMSVSRMSNDPRGLWSQMSSGDLRFGVRILLGDPGVLDALGIDHSGHAGAIARETSRCPGEILVADDAGVRSLVGCVLPGVDTRQLAAAERMEAKSFDGLMIDAWVTRPPVFRLGSPAPLVVLVHGGPESEARPGWYPEVQALAEAGLVVAQPNYRGSSGHGKKFMDANNRDWGGGDLEDLIAVVDALAVRGEIDPARVGVAGGSFGGYLTLRAVTARPERFAAAVDGYGMADLELDYRLSKDRLGGWYQTEMGTPDQDAALFRERSPIHSIDRVRAPLLVLQGKNDTNVPQSESDALVEALRQAGKTVEYVVYPDEGHEFFLRKNRIDAIERTVGFFEKHLVRRNGSERRQ